MEVSGSGVRYPAEARLSPTPKVVIAGYFDWESPLHLGSHNLATAFAAEGWDVAYVSTALSPVQALRDRADFVRRLRQFSWSGRTRGEHLWTFMPFALVTPHNVPLLRSRRVHRHWQAFSIPNVTGRLRARGFGSADILYLDNPLQMFWLDEIDFGVSVARITDRNSGYLGSAPERAVMERELVRAVDLVAHTSIAVGDELRADGVENLLYLPNGVDIHHYLGGDHSMPPDLAEIAAPIAIYVGTLDEWFDHEAINHAARKLGDVSFVIIGPNRGSGPRLEDLPNIHVLGPRPYHSLPRYLTNSHVGLIPRNTRTRGELVEAMHPLKLYEYMACGLPVVATRWQELERIASPAVLCGSPEEFADGVRAAIDDPSGEDERIDFARGASWPKRLRLLLEHAQVAAR